MDHDALSSELVRALRGRRSQGATNRRLGRSSNVAHTWERGTRAPSASDFLKLARLAGVDVDRVLAGMSPLGSAGGGAQRRQLSTWLDALAAGRSQRELAAKVGRDRNTVARWLEGVTEPRLPDLLRFVEATTQRMLDFVAAFAEPSTLPSLRAAYADLERQRRVAYDLPWAHAVLRLLELRTYAELDEHVPGFIGERIGISRELEEECLSALALAGQIYKRRSKWRVRRVLTVDTREDPEANLRLKRHWSEVALGRIGAGSAAAGSLFSYNLFAISDEGLEAIREAHLEYFERLRSIVSECKHPTRLALANVQLLRLDVVG
jgi:transcriptional regulator with XRE-family HTH domain